MKKLLLATSLLIFAFVMSCNPKAKEKVQTENIDAEGIAIKHGVPDQAKMDSLKASKTKAKQNKTKQKKN